MTDLSFYRGKRVFVTGHTGFKGAWLCEILKLLGAEVAGYALEPPTNPSVFDLCNTGDNMQSVIGDIRNFELLNKTVTDFRPDIVFHLAAQPIVRESYKEPRYTYETNVMGTVNILEAVRGCGSVASVLNVTTDKVYKNREWEWGYRENEALDGFDPYSNSKSCSELVTGSYKNSFWQGCGPAVSTARAGNVIGGGDFAKDRIVPDCVRAAQKHEPIVLRNPSSIRPFQHVLEPLFAYLTIAAAQCESRELSGCYNVGPDDSDCVSAGRIAELFCKHWGDDMKWVDISETDAPHEAGLLKLDCSRLKRVFGWHPVWNVDTAVKRVCEWTNVYFGGGSIKEITRAQILSYMEDRDV